jgi:hypothetical protein
MFVELTIKNSGEKLLFNENIIKHISSNKNGETIVHCFEYNKNNPPEYTIIVKEKYE